MAPSLIVCIIQHLYKKKRLTMRPSLLIVIGFCLLNACSAEDLLELGCINDEQCAKFENGRCQDSVCICRSRGSKEHVECRPQDEKISNIIGGPCPCSQLQAECDTKAQQCYCVADHIPSVDRRRCVPREVPLEGQCEMSRQCQLKDTFAVCHPSQKRCICKEHFEQHQGQCLALLDLSCNSTAYCESKGASICLALEKKCACSPDTVPNHNMTVCVAGAPYNASCATPAQCQLQLGAGSTCHNNRCSCRNKHYAIAKRDKDQQLISTTCEPLVPYGAYCRRNEDCQLWEVERSLEASMQCMWGECRCKENHKVVDNEKCMLISGATSQLDGYLPHLILFMSILYICI